MKHWLRTTLPAILAIALVSIISCLSAAPPRHVNPLEVPEERPNPLQLLTLYHSIALLTSSMDFDDALKLLESVKGIYVPEELRYAFNRFNQLVETVVQDIREAHAINKSITVRLALGDLREALRLARRGLEVVAKARVDYDHLLWAAESLSRLGVPPKLLQSRVKPLRDAIEALRETFNRIVEKLSVELPKAKATRVSVSVEPLEVTYGDVFKIQVCLETLDGVPLVNRVVEVHIGSSIHRVYTGFDGCNRLSHVVTEYVDWLPVYAEFKPSGSDVGRYLYSRSSVVKVHVHYIHPIIRITLGNNVLLPGQCTVLTINLVNVEDLNVTLFNPFDKPVKLYVHRGAHVTLCAPLYAKEGIYKIVVRSEPRGLVGPGKASTQLRVVKLNPVVRFSGPDIVFTGFGARIHVVSNVPGIVELLSAPEGVSARNNTIHIMLSHGFLATGFDVKILFTPLDPRYKAIVVKKHVVVVNTVVLIATLLVAVTPLALRAHRLPWIGGRGEGREVPVSGVTRAGSGLEALFYKLVEVLGRLYNVFYKPSMTIRELLREAWGKVPQSIYRVLEKALLALERLLYGRGGDKRVVEEGLRDAIEALEKKS